jgi:hypothetical protein
MSVHLKNIWSLKMKTIIKIWKFIYFLLLTFALSNYFLPSFVPWDRVPSSPMEMLISEELNLVPVVSIFALLFALSALAVVFFPPRPN